MPYSREDCEEMIAEAFEMGMEYALRYLFAEWYRPTIEDRHEKIKKVIERIFADEYGKENNNNA